MTNPRTTNNVATIRLVFLLNLVTNGSSNHAIPNPIKSGEITLNGAAARRVAPGDILILITYAIMDIEEAKAFKPALVFPDEATNLLR